MEKKHRMQKILFFLCIIVFLYSGWQLLNYYLTMKEVEREFQVVKTKAFPEETKPSKKGNEKRKSFDYEALKAQNKDTIGWIQIEDTNIDYPVMYRKNDNEFYLKKNFQKEYSVAGTPFVDGRWNPRDKQENMIIYAHHMKDGSMFAGLEQYKKKEYYESHKTIQLYLKNKLHTYEIFGALVISAKQDDPLYYVMDIASEEEYKRYIEEVTPMFLYETGKEPKNREPILMLSTCEYTKEDGRMVVLAKRVS